MPSVAHLVQPHIAGLSDYTPTTSLQSFSRQLGLPVTQLIKLDANENPYGPSPLAIAALAGEPYYAIYPDPDQTELREALSHYTGQPPARIIAGNGADEIIDLVLRVFVGPGEAVIDCPPTFGMYRFDTGIGAGRLIDVPRNPDFSLDAAAIAAVAEREHAKVLFLASPNNPNGSRTPDEVIEQLLNLPLLVVVDEAYIEFGGPSLVSMIDRYPNLAVLRTFSKWAGLAGLRIGYGLFHEELIGYLWKIKQPYNINVAAETAALASLNDRMFLLENVARIIAERERLISLLAEVPWLVPYPTQTNFVLCRVIGRDAAAVRQTLARRGILIRYYRTPALHDCIRISVGRPDQTDALIATLHTLEEHHDC